MRNSELVGSSRRFAAGRPSFRMMGYPKLRAHFGTVDNALSPQSQVSNQLINSFHLIDFCTSATPEPLWAQWLLTLHPIPAPDHMVSEPVAENHPPEQTASTRTVRRAH